MAGLIGDARELLQNILSDPFIFEYFIPKKEEGITYNQRISSLELRSFSLV